MTQIKRDALQRGVGSIYQTSDGKTFDETVVLSQSGKIIGATQNYDNQTLTSSFSFGGFEPMTGATVGQTKFDYSYGVPDTTCTAVVGNNVNAHKTATVRAIQSQI